MFEKKSKKSGFSSKEFRNNPLTPIFGKGYRKNYYESRNYYPENNPTELPPISLMPEIIQNKIDWRKNVIADREKERAELKERLENIEKEIRAEEDTIARYQNEKEKCENFLSSIENQPEDIKRAFDILSQIKAESKMNGNSKDAFFKAVKKYVVQLAENEQNENEENK